MESMMLRYEMKRLQQICRIRAEFMDFRAE